MARILIVEDDALQALALEHYLEESGHKVVGSASSAEQAIRRAGDLRPELVLIDINLRGTGNGIEAAAEIRTRFGIPHLFVSAYSDEATRKRAEATKPLGYVMKPYSPREVARAVRWAGRKLAPRRR